MEIGPNLAGVLSVLIFFGFVAFLMWELGR
jgi:hypothetical protein